MKTQTPGEMPQMLAPHDCVTEGDACDRSIVALAEPERIAQTEETRAYSP